MAVGTVKFYDLVKGFGYIKLDLGEDVYVSRKALAGDGYRYLAPGERVSVDFDYNAERDEHTVSNVRPLNPRQAGVVSRYNPQRGFGFIHVGGNEVFVHYSGILGHERRRTLEEGEEVEIEVGEGPRGPQAQVVKRKDPRQPLFRFAYLGLDQQWLPALAALAEPEPWDFANAKTARPRFTILKSYLIHTFARLEQEGNIAYGESGGNPMACFNTGLVTPLEEQILALFERNPLAEVSGTPWRLVGFVRQSDRQVLSAFARIPDMAYYFDDVAKVVYDFRKPLHVDYDHILDDHGERFPVTLRRNRHLARKVLESACNMAQMKVRRNYRTAIPQSYHGELQLLLPLCLERPDVVDLALVVSHFGDHYRGDTVLTLDMAYINARLISRPNSEWLAPDLPAAQRPQEEEQEPPAEAG